MSAGVMRGVVAFLFAILLLPVSAASAREGLSRKMHAAEAAVGREEYDIAAQYFKAECNAGGTLGCYNLAIFEHIGRIGPSNPVKSMALNRHACDLGLGDGCANLAVQLLVEENDLARAERLSARACRRNSATGCHTLELIHDGKYGGAAHPGKAAPLFDMACQLGQGAGLLPAGIRPCKAGAERCPVAKGFRSLSCRV